MPTTSLPLNDAVVRSFQRASTALAVGAAACALGQLAVPLVPGLPSSIALAACLLAASIVSRNAAWSLTVGFMGCVVAVAGGLLAPVAAAPTALVVVIAAGVGLTGTGFALLGQLALAVALAATAVAALFDIYSLPTGSSHTSLALAPAILSMVLGFSALLARPAEGPLRLVCLNTQASGTFRTLLPYFLTLPFVLGWLRLQGQQMGLYGAEFGISLLSVAMSVGLVTLKWFTTRQRLRVELQALADQASLLSKQAELKNAQAIGAVRERLVAEQRRFAALVDAAPIAIFETDHEGNCIFVNPAWEVLAGLPLEAALGQGWAKAIHPDDRKRVSDEWYAAAKATTPFSLDYRFQRPDGGISWLNGNAVALRDGADQVTGYVGSVLDVTSRREALARRFKAAEDFRQLVGNAPVGIVVAADGLIRYSNETMLKLMRASADEVAGRKVMSLLAPEHRPDFQDVDAARRAEVGAQRPRTLVRADGSSVIVEVVGTELEFEGVPSSMVVIVDVTRRIEAEAKLAQANAEVLKSLREKEILLQEVHHRVKNNLQVIASLLSLNAHKASEENTRQVLMEMRARVFAISALHERIYRSREFGRVDLKEYLEGLLNEAVRTAAGTARPALAMDIASEVVGIDEAMPVGLIVNELISNAFKHARSTQPLRLRVTLRAEGAVTILEVGDNGPGMAPTASATETLGLSLVKGLAKQLGGEVTFGSDPSGLTARVSFPRGAA